MLLSEVFFIHMFILSHLFYEYVYIGLQHLFCLKYGIHLIIHCTKGLKNTKIVQYGSSRVVPP